VSDLSTYRAVRRLNEGVAVLLRNGDSAVWAARKLRKQRACAECDRDLSAGDRVFAPVGNQMYRGERLCVTCLARMFVMLGEKGGSHQ
jgi:hypothetical protein